jgi:hypothetical protein
VDLNWGDSTDSLRLKIYMPGGSLLGTYYDNADGTIDGRIHLHIQNPNRIEKGIWIYEVYGYRVTPYPRECQFLYLSIWKYEVTDTG